MAMDLTYVLRGYEISNTSKVIYGLLEGLSRASAAKGKPYTYISRQSIADRCGVCEKTVRNALKQLNAVGLITEKRMGRGLNNHIFVFLPKTPQEEKKKTVEAADHSIFQSRTVKNPVLYTNGEKVNKTHIDKSIYPDNDKDAASRQNSGRTQAKGRPTNKRPHSNIEERKKIKKKYKDFLYLHLKVNAFVGDINTNGYECEALEKIIELMANTMAGKGRLMINGCLMNNQQWWYVVKNISQEQIIDLIYKIPHFKNVKNPNAYLLAAIYNAALQETLEKPWYNAAY